MQHVPMHITIYTITREFGSTPLFSKLTNPLLNSKLHLANSYSATHYCLTYEPLIKPLLRCCEVITEY